MKTGYAFLHTLFLNGSAAVLLKYRRAFVCERPYRMYLRTSLAWASLPSWALT